MESKAENNRILIIDDNEAIHRDFRRILQLAEDDSGGVDDLAAELFGAETQTTADMIPALTFDVDAASQGREGVEMVQRAVDEGKPYAVAFVDMRMPPGWDGLETTRRIWMADPDCEIVICTAYADRSWDEIRDALPQSDRFLILKKPFDSVEAQQLANALTRKWSMERKTNEELKRLQKKLAELQCNQSQLIPPESPSSANPLPIDAVREISGPVEAISDNLSSVNVHMQTLTGLLSAGNPVDEIILGSEIGNATSLVAESARGIAQIKEVLQRLEHAAGVNRNNPQTQTGRS